MNRDRRHLLGLAPALLLGSALGSTSSFLSPLAAARPKRPRQAKAALLLPLSGPSAMIGLSMRRAAMLARSPAARADDLLIFDTGGSAESARAATARALRGGARILIGPLFAEESRAAAEVVATGTAADGAGGGVPLLSFSNDEQLIGAGPFLLGITAGQSVTAVLRYARGRGVRRVAVLGGASRWSAQGQAAAERLRGAAGLDIVMLPAGTDPAGLSDALRRTGGGELPDALLVTQGGDALRLAARATTGSGLQLLGTQQSLDLPSQDVAGAWLAGADPSAMNEFASRYQAGGAGAPGLLAALAHDAMTIVEMLRASGVVDRSALLAMPSFDTMTGPIRFAADGSATRALAILVARPDGYTVADRSGSL